MPDLKKEIEDFIAKASKGSAEQNAEFQMITRVMGIMSSIDPDKARTLFVDAMVGSTRAKLHRTLNDLITVGRASLTQCCSDPDHTPENKARAHVADMLIQLAVELAPDNSFVMESVRHNIDQHPDNTGSIIKVSTRAEFDALPDEVKVFIPQEYIDKLH